MVEPLAGEAAFAEQVLIGVGDRGRVGIDPGVPGIDAREQRAGRTRHRDAHPGLEDRIALDDPPERGVEARAIERVLDHADQLTRRIARQAGIAVEREAVADARQDGRIAPPYGEARVGGAPQQPVELLDLAAFALPTHPHPLAAIPTAGAVEQVEAVRGPGRVTRVERIDRR
ncbi:MAG: hypothetical protein E6K81_16510, partial [Candidatus Eisenbacteria bacterium]